MINFERLMKGADLMALNIIDIAKLAGVSKSTVSRYLNNGYVSVESRDQVTKVLDKIGGKI